MGVARVDVSEQHARCARINGNVDRARRGVELAAARARDTSGDVDVAARGRDIVDDDAVVDRVVPGRNALGVGPRSRLIRSFLADEVGRSRRINRGRRTGGKPLAADRRNAALRRFVVKIHAPDGVAALNQTVEIDVVGIEINIAARRHDAAGILEFIRRIGAGGVRIGFFDFVGVKLLNIAANVE